MPLAAPVTTTWRSANSIRGPGSPNWKPDSPGCSLAGMARAPGARQSLPAQTGRAPASARGAKTREALVQAARRVFERDGFLDARITDIAVEAGVAAGSFYTYFTSKEDAFAAVLEQVGEEMLHPRIRELADRDDPISVIEAANRAYLVAYRRNARLMGLLEQVSQVNEDFRRLRAGRTRAFGESVLPLAS